MRIKQEKAVKNSRMTRKKFVSVLLFALTLIIAAVTLCACDNTQERLAKECVRIHIRANSNLDKDQAVKLAVRDEITAYLSSRLENCKSKAEAVKTLEKEENNLVEIANSTLYKHGFEYKASIALKSEHFPDRKYDGYTFPEGDYDALIIYLGEGVGDNWWCVAFPPLCFVPDTKSGEKIVYKSWVKEWLERLFGSRAQA